MVRRKSNAAAALFLLGWVLGFSAAASQKAVVAVAEGDKATTLALSTPGQSFAPPSGPGLRGEVPVQATAARLDEEQLGAAAEAGDGQSPSKPRWAASGGAVPDNTVVELPLFEYTVLRELRAALSESGEDGENPSLPEWSGEQTTCVWSSEEGCRCTWDGVACKYRHDKRGWRVSSIVLASRQLSGTIPSVLSDLEALEVLNLAYNRLHGTVPATLSSLTSLRTVYLHSNRNLGGALPPAFSRMSSLRNINLSGNLHTGNLPPTWDRLRSLDRMDLSGNQLRGTLPKEWSALTGLRSLGLENNLLIGALPKEWTAMASHSQHELELNLYDNMLLPPVPPAFNSVADRMTTNFRPQDGQMPVNRSSIPVIEDDDDWPMTPDDMWPSPSHARALLLWISTFLCLISVSVAWLCCARRLRSWSRRQRFAKRCASLTRAEQKYLDEHHEDVLLLDEAACGSGGRDGSSWALSVPPVSEGKPHAAASRSADSLVEIGLLKQRSALRDVQPVSSAGLDSSVSNGSSGLASSRASSKGSAPSLAPVSSRPPRAALEEILALQSTWSALEAPGRLGSCYRALFRGRQVVVKAVDVPRSSVAAVRVAAQALQDAAPHPNLLLPAASGASKSGSSSSPSTAFLVYDQAPGGSLLEWLRGSPPASMSGMSLPWPTRLRHAHEIAEGLVALAARGIAHGSLHPGNVVLDGALHAKIVHAGLAPMLLALAYGDAPSSPGLSAAAQNPAEHVIQIDMQPVETTVDVIDSPFLASSSTSASAGPDFRPPSTPAAPLDFLRRPPSALVAAGPHTDPAFSAAEGLTPASDVYSFGVILLQLLTGRTDADGLLAYVRGLLLRSGGLPSISSGRLTAEQAQAVQKLLDPSAGCWPLQSAAAVLSLALACTEERPRNRPDLRFHVAPRLTTLAREASSWMLHSGASSASSAATAGLSTHSDGTPAVFLCPITREPMQDPVVASDGYTYEREAIQRWMDEAAAAAVPLTSPMTNLPLVVSSLVPVHSLRSEITSWRASHSPGKTQ